MNDCHKFKFIYAFLEGLDGEKISQPCPQTDAIFVSNI